VVDERQDRKAGYIVSALVGLTLAILCGFTVVSFLGSRGLASGEGAIEIEVTGYQWWWQIKYPDPQPSRTFTTANDLHIPVGRPVKLLLKSGDVIHSFWVPNLAGKKDLIPGQQNELTFSADRPGSYRGQCAEFCGLQHAKMALRVIAEPSQDFEAWRDRQLQPAMEVNDPSASAGRQVFERKACILCHTIRGTKAGGRYGPDLTHFGSRETIAAGTLPNDRDHLKRWIANPQAFKPGTKMPQVPLDEDELNAISAYLGALK
jgi:cytochrome c oxidase subunit 2